MDQKGNGGGKKTEGKNKGSRTGSVSCYRNRMCVALATSLTLLLPGEYYQNSSSHCKQKKDHNDGWSEDVLNHVQAARKKEFMLSCSSG